MAFVIELNAILWFLVPIIASREVINAVIFITKLLSALSICRYNMWMLVQHFSSRIFPETNILFQVPVYYLNADFDYWNMLDWNRPDIDCLHTVNSMTMMITMAMVRVMAMRMATGKMKMKTMSCRWVHPCQCLSR